MQVHKVKIQKLHYFLNSYLVFYFSGVGFRALCFPLKENIFSRIYTHYLTIQFNKSVLHQTFPSIYIK